MILFNDEFSRVEEKGLTKKTPLLAVEAWARPDISPTPTFQRKNLVHIIFSLSLLLSALI